MAQQMYDPIFGIGSMNKDYTMRFLTGLLLSIFFASPVLADNLPKEIWGYRDTVVTFSKSAGQCNLNDAALLKERLRVKLAEIGIKQSDETNLVAIISVSATGVGMLKTQCASNVQLSFESVLRAENIVTDNERTRKIVDRLGQIPIIVYQIGMFGVQSMQQPAAGGDSMDAQKAVIDMIDKLVARLA